MAGPSKLSKLLAEAVGKGAPKKPDLWYHGTNADIKGGKLTPQGSFGDHNNLGPGINLTRDPKVAEQYIADPFGASVWMGRTTGRYAPAQEYGALVTEGRNAGLSNADAVANAHRQLQTKGYAGIEDADRGDRLVFNGRNLRTPFPKPDVGAQPRQRYELGGAMLGETYAVPATKRAVTSAFKITDEPRVFKTDAGKKMLVVPGHTNKASPFGGKLNVVSEKSIADPLEIDHVLKTLAVPAAIGTGAMALGQPGQADAAPLPKAMRFFDPRLKPQANKAIEMLKNGYSRADVVDELALPDPKQLSVLLSQARANGVDVPLAPRSGGPSQTVRPRVARLATQKDAFGIPLSNAQIGERVGISKNAVAQQKTLLRKSGLLSAVPATAAGLYALSQPDKADAMNFGPAARIADRAALQTAKRMFAKGALQQDIYGATKWFRDGSGKWGFEAPDNDLRVFQGGMHTGPDGGKTFISELVQHPLLFDAYPRLGHQTGAVRIGPSGAPVSSGAGYYHASGKELPYSAGWMGGWKGNFHIEGGGQDGARSTAAHELQHFVDRVENRPYGLYGAGHGFDGTADPAWQANIGEVRARNAQTRLDFSPAQREQTPWPLTEDQPRGQQITKNYFPGQRAKALSTISKAGAVAGGSALALSQPQEAEAAGFKLPSPKALHVSPYSFDKFDISKIGSGEGSSAFGHGLYFTDKANPHVADYYRDFFTKRGQNPVTYEADLGVDPHSLAKWDKPIADQSRTIQDAFSDLYQTPRSKLQGGQKPQPQGAMESNFLKERGVPGLQYDAGSLWGGGGGKNYVMFDDKPISITRKIGGDPLGSSIGGTNAYLDSLANLGEGRARAPLRLSTPRISLEDRLADGTMDRLANRPDVSLADLQQMADMARVSREGTKTDLADRVAGAMSTDPVVLKKIRGAWPWVGGAAAGATVAGQAQDADAATIKTLRLPVHDQIGFLDRRIAPPPASKASMMAKFAKDSPEANRLNPAAFPSLAAGGAVAGGAGAFLANKLPLPTANDAARYFQQQNEDAWYNGAKKRTDDLFRNTPRVAPTAWKAPADTPGSVLSHLLMGEPAYFNKQTLGEGVADSLETEAAKRSENEPGLFGKFRAMGPSMAADMFRDPLAWTDAAGWVASPIREAWSKRPGRAQQELAGMRMQQALQGRR